MKYTHIIWDFNGTLMNDVDIAIAAVNDMLTKRGMEVTNKADYLNMIESPIIEYYKKIFDLSIVSFDDIQVEFLESYNLRLPEAGLMDGAAQALEAFASLGAKQCVISSFEQTRLMKMIRDMGIMDYFSEISGADNTRAESKLDRGAQWLKRSGADPQKCLVIGDLVHDYELASHLGADCALVAVGHQHRRDLEACGTSVFNNISEMMRSVING